MKGKKHPKSKKEESNNSNNNNETLWEKDLNTPSFGFVFYHSRNEYKDLSH